MPIEKREIEPKTYELYNTDRDRLGPTPITQAGQEAYDEIRSGALGAQMFEETNMPPRVGTREYAEQATPRQQRVWRKQINNFLRNQKVDTKKGRQFDAAQGIQEMIDSGAMWMEEDGAYTSVPVPGEKKRQALVDASDRWLDYQHSLGRTQYDPDRGWVDPSANAEVDEYMRRVLQEENNLASDEMNSHMQRQ